MPTRRPGDDGDPVGNFSFDVEIDGVTAGSFAGVDGLQVENDMVEWASGEDHIIRKRPGIVKYGDVTLKRGYVTNTILEDWLEDSRTGWGKADYLRKSISIILFDNAQGEVLRWNCFECYPKTWKVTGLDSKGNDVVYEEVTFWTEWFEKEKS